MEALEQVNITGSAKCHTSISFYSFGGQTCRMKFPRRNLRRMLLACEMAMNFVMRGMCIDVDSTALKT